MLIAEDLMLLLTGDDVLDEALTMVTSKEGKKPQTVVTALGEGTRGRLYERLAASGILRAEEGRVLGLWTEREFPGLGGDDAGRRPPPRDGMSASDFSG